jgi:hypothetical protein
MNNKSADSRYFGTVVPFSWYRGCTSAATAHFNEMARERCNAVRIDVSEEDLVLRIQEVAAVVQLAAAARLKAIIGLCGFGGVLGQGSLSQADAERSLFLRDHPSSMKVDGCGLSCAGQVCSRNPEFIDYVCALCCVVGCMQHVGGISAVHPRFSACFCALCSGGHASLSAGGDESSADRSRFRYQRRMTVLPDENEEEAGLLPSSAIATLHLLQAMFLSFRAAPSLAKSASAASVFGASLMRGSQADAASHAFRVIELSPHPSVTQPAADALLGSVPAATHIVLALPHTVVQHKQQQTSGPLGSENKLPTRKYEVHPRPAEPAAEACGKQDDALGGGESRLACCWDALAVVVESSVKCLRAFWCFFFCQHLFGSGCRNAEMPQVAGQRCGQGGH